MATQSRTLKLSILAETKQLSDALKGSGKNVTTFGSQISAFGKKAALAFAAAGVAFGAFDANEFFCSYAASLHVRATA